MDKLFLILFIFLFAFFIAGKINLVFITGYFLGLYGYLYSDFFIEEVSKPYSNAYEVYITYSAFLFYILLLGYLAVIIYNLFLLTI